ncbi:MAG: SDR family oxidoreductase [Pseudomonadota bacterium]
MAADRHVLVVGATGHLGSQVVDALLQRGSTVRALVRESSDTASLSARNVSLAHGDLRDEVSLRTAVAGVDAVVTSAIAYSNRKRGDAKSDADTGGNANLVRAAADAGAARFVYTSILNCDDAPDVPHFRAKRYVEDLLSDSGLSFTALRPGAFIDQASDFWIKGLRKGRLDALGNPDVRWSYVHTGDLAGYLAEACFLGQDAPQRIDIGCDRAVSMREIAAIMTDLAGRPIRLRSLPWPLARAAFRVAGWFDPWQADFARMFDYILSGRYVADTTQQARLFGPPRPIEDALRRYLRHNALL